MRWSERRTAVRSTFEMTSTLPLRAARGSRPPSLILFSLGEKRAMPEIIYYVASSLDGYIATADGSVDWLSLFHTAGEDHGAAELEASVDALLLGSHTYEFALKLGQWPSPDKLSWVFTLRRAWLMGGGKLAASFHADQLISRRSAGLSALPSMSRLDSPSSPKAHPHGLAHLCRSLPSGSIPSSLHWKREIHLSWKIPGYL